MPRIDETEVTLQELADRLGAHRQTVYGWLRRGKLKGRLARVGTQRIWQRPPTVPGASSPGPGTITMAETRRI